jgi:hypothetical protein
LIKYNDWFTAYNYVPGWFKFGAYNVCRNTAKTNESAIATRTNPIQKPTESFIGFVGVGEGLFWLGAV